MPVPRHLRVVDLELGEPVGRLEHDAGGPFVDDALKTLEGGRCRRAVRQLADQPQPRATHGEGEQGALRSEEGVHARRVQVVPGLDVTEHEPLAHERALESGADERADAAVPAVRPHDPAHGGRLGRAVRSPQARADRLGVLVEGRELDAPLDVDAQLVEAFAEHTLGLGLGRGQRVGKGAPHAVEADVGELATVGVHRHPAGPDAGLEEPVRDAHQVQHLETARVHQQRPGLDGRLCQLVDDAYVDAAPRELARGDEAHGPGADDQDAVGGR